MRYINLHYLLYLLTYRVYEANAKPHKVALKSCTVNFYGSSFHCVAS